MNVKGDSTPSAQQGSGGNLRNVLPFEEEGGFFRLSPDAQSLLREVAKSQQDRIPKSDRLRPAANQ